MLVNFLAELGQISLGMTIRNNLETFSANFDPTWLSKIVQYWLTCWQNLAMTFNDQLETFCAGYCCELSVGDHIVTFAQPGRYICAWLAPRPSALIWYWNIVKELKILFIGWCKGQRLRKSSSAQICPPNFRVELIVQNAVVLTRNWKQCTSCYWACMFCLKLLVKTTSFCTIILALKFGGRIWVLDELGSLTCREAESLCEVGSDIFCDMTGEEKTYSLFYFQCLYKYCLVSLYLSPSAHVSTPVSSVP